MSQLNLFGGAGGGDGGDGVDGGDDDAPGGRRELPQGSSGGPGARPDAGAERPRAGRRRAPRAVPAGSSLRSSLWGAPRSVPLHLATRQRYLNYALSVITSRAIPDVRDGLKPVQRRILYAMHRDLRLHANAKPRKSAAVVGEVMGRYHPHGDSAIYDAMVRMAQPFNLRCPLVFGQGNFGSLDGDPAAAMRYTEARLQALAGSLLAEIEQDTVAFRPNYDGTRDEPVVLPAAFPNLLVNGGSGIAVGMATQIPPHNLGEVTDACLALLNDPELDVDDLCAIVPGPDFPTGGEILSTPEELRQVYATGRGAIKFRGSWTEERIDRRDCVIITAVPYQQNKATLVEKISALILARKVPQLVDVRDESTDEVRVVLELKRGARADEAMAYLCRHTPLQQTFHMQLNCLVPTERPEVGAPRCLGLKEVLHHFLEFRTETVRRRLQHQLGLLERRIHILEGFERIFGAIEEAIRIVLRAKDRADAAAKLMARFELDAEQAKAILDTRLYRLARLEIETVRAELAAKRAEAEGLRAILADAVALRGLIADELQQVRTNFADERRTRIGVRDTLDFDPRSYVVREDTWVIVTRDGWLKRQGSFTDLSSIRLREGSEIGWVIRTHTLATITFFTTHGQAYTLRVADIKATTGHGDPIQVHCDFGDGERLVGVICHDPRCLIPPGGAVPSAASRARPAADTSPDGSGAVEGGEQAPDGEGASPPAERPARAEVLEEAGLVVAVTRLGRGLRIALEGYREPSTRAGRRYARLSPGASDDAVVAAHPLFGGENVSLATEGGRVLLFAARELKVLLNAGRGVKAIRLGADDRVLAMGLSRGRDEGVVVLTQRGREVRVSPRRYRVASRGGKGTEVIRRGGLKTWVLPDVVPLGAPIEEG